ncbi:MAG TPA: hypothetical protein VFA05_05605 [Gaiellaceae bacterium]|nr:hypothetical protein [Gaiellaceae bacterium]
MDLRLYGRVLWRFKYLVVGGFIAAILLSMLSYFRITFQGGRPHLAYRHAVTYASAETLLITQTGFPAGRSIFPMTITRDGAVSNFADPSRFSSLADFYAYLANSDAVTAAAQRRAGRVVGAYSASPVVSHLSNNTVEPLLQVQGYGETPASAVRYANAGAEAFMHYLSREQAIARIPQAQRVVVTVLNRAAGAAVVTPRKKTVPVVVFVAVLAATIALALFLENLRPRIKAVEGGYEREAAEPRRSTA